MKLYTEEQVINMLKFADSIYGGQELLSIDDLLYDNKPIELPTDEEIDRIADKYLIKGKEVFIHGAKWMRDKIKGGNK